MNGDGLISVDDYHAFLSDQSAAAELPEFIRLAILEGIGLISDRGQLEQLLIWLQWGGLVLSGLIIPAGGLSTTLGRLIFSAAMVVSAAELVVSGYEGDDLGVLLAAAGIVFDSLDIAALATSGLKGAATVGNVTVGTGGLRLDDILVDLSDDASLILGDAMAAGRYINHAEIFDLNQADELLDAVMATRLDELSSDGQAAYHRLLTELRAAEATAAELFSNDLLGVMIRDWDSPALNADEMTALYRATSPDRALTDAELLARHQDGLRYDPASPSAWPHIAALACQSFSADTLVLLADGTYVPRALVVSGVDRHAGRPDTSNRGVATATLDRPRYGTAIDDWIELWHGWDEGLVDFGELYE